MIDPQAQKDSLSEPIDTVGGRWSVAGGHWPVAMGIESD